MSVVHTVVSGDSLWRIATRYNISVERLKQLNGLATNSLSLGQKLIVSEPKANTATQSAAAPVGRTHTVAAGDSLWRIATQYSISVTDIRTWNKLTTDALSLGQRLIVSAPQSGAGAVSSSSSQNTTSQNTKTTQEPRFHVVQMGDSMWRIANQYQISVAEIRAWNNLTSDVLSLGQRLAVSPAQTSPSNTNQNTTSQNNNSNSSSSANTSQQTSQAISVPTHVVGVGDSLWRVASRYNISVQDIRRFNDLQSDLLSIGQVIYLAEPQKSSSSPSQNQTTQSAGQDFYYTVQAGDSLWKIAQHFNVSVESIRTLNRLDSNALSLGQRLLLRKESSSNPAPTTSSASSSSTSQIKASVSALPNADFAFETPSAERLAQIKRNLAQTVQMQELNCVAIFGNGLSASVGRGAANHADDVEKVQRALVERKLLQTIGGVSQLQPTIAAIESFQSRNNLEWWASKPALIGGKGGFTRGLVAQDDATYTLLRNHTTFRITYQDHQNRPQNIQFTNFLRSNFSVYAGGVSFSGTAVHEIPKSFFESAGLSPTLSEALAFVSKNEGNYDAINSYDKAAFSFGFIQFAGRTGGGTLPQFLALAKHQNPEAFEEAFGKFGIDVEFAFRNNKYEPAQVVVVRPDNSQILRGTDAEMYLRTDKILHAIFVRAGHQIEVAKLQVLAAVQEYVNPALRSRISLDVNGISVDKEPTTDYIRSALGITVLIDMAINQGLTGALRLFKPAIEGAARQLNIRSKEALQNIDERVVIQQMIANATDSRVRTRPQKALDAGISSRK
ncbi:LysM peptidoglycan-binding domain-containing protein [Hugenholtzia roseola]|uniref:LysM peptidoglycan-binding domain-containing protein n=1 Tax=Hugenholtzia roseola TaxID=1002 RepID=UPI00041187DF|nr:LysM peptidoglycan-binding domain-containing protein [Hugenholtzia roseola]